MKAKRFAFTIFFLLAICPVHSRAQGKNPDLKWLAEVRANADEGDANSQCALASVFLVGTHGVAKNYAEGVKWLRKAAEQNFPNAEYNLGFCYQNAQGVGRDYAEAAKWYRKAAAQNYGPAQYNLGVCYEEGDGVSKDYVESYKWLLLAGAQGQDNAKQAVAMIESKMSQQQVADGQKLARDFKPLEPGFNKSSEMRPMSSGTGFFITADGYLITNEHVVGRQSQVRLSTAMGLITAKVLKVSTANDLALLKAEGRFASLAVGTSRGVKLGNTVATVGFPNIGLQGFAPKFARGEIGSLTGPQDDARYFQISVPVQPGNSGGALVDERGNVVGVVSAKLDARTALITGGALPENVNYAVKSSFLLGFLESAPEVAAKLKEPNTKEVKFADVVEQTKEAAVLVLVY